MRGVPIEAFHALPVADIAVALEGDAERGLDDTEAANRLRRVGPNAVDRAQRPRYLEIAARQVWDPLVALLIAATVVSAFVGETVEASVIAAIVVLNAILGFSEELSAERAVLALREAVPLHAAVVRAGVERLIPAEHVVPGDLIMLREGERVPADGRLIRAEGLAVDEAPLTGESLPVEKSLDPVPADAPLAERSSMVFAGTGVTRGRALALVTSTGTGSEVGRIAELTSGARPPATPLQKRINGLARIMAAVGIIITGILAAAMLARGSSAHEAFLVGVSVAVAAVPEGLAATVTIALALGARAMAKRGAIVRRLSAVETLGSATIVASDKTGTLTKNELRLAATAPVGDVDERRLLLAGALASTAELIEDNGSVRVAGDPVDGAFLLAARDRGISPEREPGGGSTLRELPFDSSRKRMTVVYGSPEGTWAYVKGAPEVILERSALSEEQRAALQTQAEAWARNGLRVLAVA
jgi:Ca2+-transporting ATPase